MKVIINADDCGYNKVVNEAIERFIDKKCLTSTTIMANMDDFNGALYLYDKYNSEVSFGVHLNLTEGSPILNSQMLLDFGITKEYLGGVIFTGNIHNYQYGSMPIELKHEIYKECDIQMQKLRDNGVNISHIDSHHHIHTIMPMMSIIDSLSEKYSVYKVRRVRNYYPNINIVSRFMRNCWWYLLWLKNSKLRTTDLFTSVSEWIEGGLYKKTDSQIIEIMCHPGGIYLEEELLLLNFDFSSYFNLTKISYNDL